MAAVQWFGYNPGSGTGHTHATPDLTGWQDAYQHIGPGATSAVAGGSPFGQACKLFDVAAGYPSFPTSWTGAAATIAANNGGVKFVPIFAFGSGPGPSTTPPTVAAIVTFLTSVKNTAAAGQTAAFNFISEVESASDGLSPSQYVTNWGILSANLNQALAQMGGPPFWTRANFPLITSSRMDYYGTNPGSTAWLPPPSQVDSYGCDFYQHIGGANSVGAQSDARFQGWAKAVHAVAGANVSMSFGEYGIGFTSGAYSAANEAGRAALLAKDYAYMTGSSRPSGSAGMLFWDYWYQMDTAQSPANIYCFPLAPSPATETQAQAFATISQWQSMTSGVTTGQNRITVTPPGTQNATAGQTASLQITATDSNPALQLTYTAGGTLPPGLSINSTTGLITGTFTGPGTFAVTVSASDTTGASGSATFTWVVNPNTVPAVAVTNPGNQASVINIALSLLITAADSAGNTVTFTATGLPTGLSISSGGLITGTPTVNGKYTVTVTGTDTASAVGTATFTWTIAATVVTVTNPGAQHNLTTDSVSLQIIAKDSTAGQTLSYAAAGLPGGLSINSATGLITGTPSTANTAVTVTVTDLAGSHGTASFTWVVTTPTGPTVIVVNPGNQTSNQFQAITGLQMTATDSAGHPITFGATGLPAGLSCSSGGLITGTPTAVGVSTVTVTGTDSVLATGTAVFTWTVVAPVVTVSSPGNQSSILNEVISLHITATDSAGAGYTFTAAGLPTGLSISLAGLITGTCTAAAVFSTTITATDTHGITGAAAITWTVAAVTVTVVQPIDQINNVGDTVSLPVTAIDSSDNTLTWSAANLPFPLIINPTTGLITGSPQTPGIYTVVVTALDATASVSGTTGFNWTIDVSTPVLAISLAPAAGTDIYGNKYPAGVTVGPTGGSRTTIGMNGLLTYSTPQIKMPTMNGAWSSTTGHATIQLDALGNLVISWKILTVGATADGTLVWAIGSLPTGYRPKFKRRLSVYTDVPAAAKGPAFELDPNGSVLCYGIGAAATRVELYVAAPIFL